jgi:hypothetical protein
MASGRRRCLAGAAGLVVLAACATACTTKTKVDLGLKVDAVAAPGGGIILIGTASSCDEFELDVASKGSTFVLSAGGTMPRKEGDYCDRYIDTGGSSPGPRTATKRVKAEPGRYEVRAKKGGHAIEVLYRDGVVGTAPQGSSAQGALDARVDELAWQQRATLVAGHRLEGLLPGWSLSECAPTIRNDSRTECRLTSPPKTVASGHDRSRPFPAEALADLGCVAVEPTAKQSEVTCPLGTVEGRKATLHTRTSWFDIRHGTASTVIWVAG